MIARSDRLSPCRSTKGQPVQLRFDSPDDCAPGTANRWDAKAKPPVSHPGGFAVNAHEIGKVIYPNNCGTCGRF